MFRILEKLKDIVFPFRYIQGIHWFNKYLLSNESQLEWNNSIYLPFFSKLLYIFPNPWCSQTSTGWALIFKILTSMFSSSSGLFSINYSLSLLVKSFSLYLFLFLNENYVQYLSHEIIPHLPTHQPPPPSHVPNKHLRRVSQDGSTYSPRAACGKQLSLFTRLLEGVKSMREGHITARLQ